MLEKLARALEIPMYRLFTNDAHVKKPNIPISKIESTRNGKQDAQASPICEGIVADERQGPKASASHGVKNGEPGVGKQ
jgi:hypothetical protein